MSDQELDGAEISEFVSLQSRVRSFNGTSLVEKVPAGRIAHAGFFYTGHGEKVQCFSCSKILDNWSSKDFPLERHKAVSPRCPFIRCVSPKHRAFEYRLRRRYVVVPHMRSEETRLQTFAHWPASSHMRPCDLAQAGLYCVGEADSVQCFCCGGYMLQWEPGDTAWGEHEKHFSNCFFVLGHDVGNIPLQGGSQEEGNGRNHVHMGTFEERLESFQGINHPISREQDEDPMKKLEKLQREKLCKICMDRDICMVFVPCGHLVVCQYCSGSLTKCPICCCLITQKIKTYIS